MTARPSPHLDLSRRAQALEALHTLSLELSAQLDMGRLLRQIIEFATDLIDADAGGSIYLYEPEYDHLRLVEAVDFSRKYIGWTLKPGDGLAGKVFVERKALAVQDYQNWPGRSEKFRDEPVSTLLSAPLLWHEEAIGTLNVVRAWESRPFDDDDLWLAGLFAAQAAIAITNARLYRAEREAQIRFQDIALATSDWLWETDMQGVITYCSPQVHGIVGYQAGELLGRPAASFLSPAEGERLAELSRQALGDNTLFEFEGVFTHREGHDVILEVRGAIIRDAQGQPIGFRGAARDVTARRLAERREQLAYEIGQQMLAVLSLTELLNVVSRRIRETLDYYHVHVFLLDDAGERMVFRAGTVDLASPEEHLPYTIPLDARPSLIAQAARSRQIVVSNDTRLDPDFLPNPLLPDTRSETALPLFRGERLLGVLVIHSAAVNHFTQAELHMLENLAAGLSIAIDNARLVAAIEQQADHLEELVVERTAEIARQRERLTAIVENAGEGIVFTARDGLVEYANPAWERLTGIPTAQAVGRDLFELMGLGDDVRRLLSQTLREAADAGQGWHGDVHARRPDGSEYAAGVSIAPVLGAGLEVVNLVGVMRDITAGKEVERMRTRFVANVSHELRTPITNLKLYQTLLRSGPAEKRATYMDTMASELGRLERLVEDLLDLSRLDRGVVAMNPQPLDLNELVEEVIRTYQLRAEARSLSLTVELAARLPHIQADHERIRQVIVNLLTNAINYTDSGAQIGVRTWFEGRKATRQVGLAVWDTGPGIAPEDLPFIFNRFFRAETARVTETPGTGLGLSIVREIVELHHGQIRAESKPGQGTTFTILLPVKRP